MSAAPSPPPRRESMTRATWAIALPAMLTNIATALFGIADLWVIGRLGDAPMQGAVELGAKFMLGLLTVFNFLKTSTVALTAQASGRDDEQAQAAALVRALAVALAIGALILLARPLAIWGGLELLEAQGEVRGHARDYIGTRYWASAAWLVNAVLVGWLIGRRRLRAVLVVEVVTNAAHIALNFLFVLGMGWGVIGVAAATVISEFLKLALLAAIVLQVPAARAAWALAGKRATWAKTALGDLFSINRDLFFGTLLLTGAMLIFARAGAQQGAVTLAANGILFQLFMLATLMLDGFENSSQVLCGESKGARDGERFVEAAKVSLFWGGVFGVAMTVLYFLFGGALASTFSTGPAVIEEARNYAFWLALLPILGVASFVLDGIFLGAGWTRAMLVTMIGAMAVYCGLLWGLSPLSNVELWAVFCLFFVIRAGGQFAWLPRLVGREFGK